VHRTALMLMRWDAVEQCSIAADSSTWRIPRRLGGGCDKSSKKMGGKVLGAGNN